MRLTVGLVFLTYPFLALASTSLAVAVTLCGLKLLPRAPFSMSLPLTLSCGDIISSIAFSNSDGFTLLLRPEFRSIPHLAR